MASVFSWNQLSDPFFFGSLFQLNVLSCPFSCDRSPLIFFFKKIQQISDIRECRYEKMGIGSSYLFRLDDGYVVGKTTIICYRDSMCILSYFVRSPIEGLKRMLSDTLN